MLKEQIEKELKGALKSGDRLRVAVLRMLASAIHNREIEKRSSSGQARPAVLTDEEVIQVVRAETKKREDAAPAYERGGRPEAAEREKQEARMLEEFLPPALSEAELEELVSQGMRELGISSPREFGRLMGWVMSRVQGRASGERVAAVVKKRLGA